MNNSNIVVLQGEELQSIIYQCVCKALAEHTAVVQSQAPEQVEGGKMLSSDKVCELLHTTPHTLWRWNKANYLCPVKVGAKNLYKLEDVERLMKA